MRGRDWGWGYATKGEKAFGMSLESEDPSHDVDAV